MFGAQASSLPRCLYCRRKEAFSSATTRGASRECGQTLQHNHGRAGCRLCGRPADNNANRALHPFCNLAFATNCIFVPQRNRPPQRLRAKVTLGGFQTVASTGARRTRSRRQLCRMVSSASHGHRRHFTTVERGFESAAVRCVHKV